MNWGDFRAACEVLLTVDGSSSRQTIGGYNAILLRNGVSDLQRFIPQLRNNQRNTYRVVDLAQEGETSLGTLPDKASVREAFLIKKTCPCNIFPLVPYQWEYRFDLICDKPRRHEWPYYIAIDPSATEFMAYPKLKEDDELWIYWDGMKTDYADTDPVRFGEEEALAVSYYIKGHISREVDKDLALKRDYLESYRGSPGMMGLRTKLFLDWKDRGEIRKPIRPPDPSCAQCSPCDSIACCWNYNCTTGGFSQGFWYLKHPTTGNWHKITTSEETGDVAIKIYDGIANDCIVFDECLTAAGKGYKFSGGYFNLLNETTGTYVALSIVGAPGEEMIKMEPQKGTIGHISTTAFGYRLLTCLELRNLDESCDKHTWHALSLVDIGAPQLAIGGGDCVICPTIPPADQPPQDGFLSAQQTVSCPSGSGLIVTGTLAPYLSVSGLSLILAAGHSGSMVDQATANAEALAALQEIFDDGIASGLFVCGMFQSAQQSVSCEIAGALVANIALPSYLTISGGSLIMEAGHIESGVDQATANATALAALQAYFDAGIASGDLECPEPPLEPPIALTGCSGWFKADSLVLADGDPVSLWADSSGNARDLIQAAGASRPLWKANIFGTQPALLFDGVDDFMANLGLFGLGGVPSCTIFILYKHFAADNNGMLIGEGTSDCQLWSQGATNVVRVWDGQGTIGMSAALTTPATSPRVVIFRNQVFSPGNLIRENKTNKGPVTQSNIGFEFRTVGRAGDAFPPSFYIYHHGYIAEIICYCTRLSDADCDLIYDNYFKVKYPVLP